MATTTSEYIQRVREQGEIDALYKAAHNLRWRISNTVKDFSKDREDKPFADFEIEIPMIEDALKELHAILAQARACEAVRDARQEAELAKSIKTFNSKLSKL